MLKHPAIARRLFYTIPIKFPAAIADKAIVTPIKKMYGGIASAVSGIKSAIHERKLR